MYLKTGLTVIVDGGQDALIFDRAKGKVVYEYPDSYANLWGIEFLDESLEKIKPSNTVLNYSVTTILHNLNGDAKPNRCYWIATHNIVKVFREATGFGAFIKKIERTKG